MPKLEYFLVCESISVDQDTNRISLFNIIEDLQAITHGQTPEKPLVTQMVAVCCWNKEDGDEGKEFQATFKMCPSGDIGENKVEMNFKMESPRHRLYLRLQGVPVVSGNLIIDLELNGDHQASHKITFQPSVENN